MNARNNDKTTTSASVWKQCPAPIITGSVEERFAVQKSAPWTRQPVICYVFVTIPCRGNSTQKTNSCGERQPRTNGSPHRVSDWLAKKISRWQGNRPFVVHWRENISGIWNVLQGKRFAGQESSPWKGKRHILCSVANRNRGICHMFGPRVLYLHRESVRSRRVVQFTMTTCRPHAPRAAKSTSRRGASSAIAIYCTEKLPFPGTPYLLSLRTV